MLSEDQLLATPDLHLSPEDRRRKVAVQDRRVVENERTIARNEGRLEALHERLRADLDADLAELIPDDESRLAAIDRAIDKHVGQPVGAANLELASDSVLEFRKALKRG